MKPVTSRHSACRMPRSLLHFASSAVRSGFCTALSCLCKQPLPSLLCGCVAGVLKMLAVAHCCARCVRSLVSPAAAETPASGREMVPHLLEVLRAPDHSGPLFRHVPAPCFPSDTALVET